MAYIVTRNKKSGYVSFVKKERVPVAGGKTSVRNTDYVCGLGVMTQQEFEEFRGWAHGITCQETRKASVLACPKVILTGKETAAKVAGEQQKITTVKRAKKAKTVWSDKSGVRKHFPVPELSGYRGKTHTQTMMEERKQAAAEAEMQKMQAKKPLGKEKWATKPYFEPGMGKGSSATPIGLLARREKEKERRIGR